MKVYDTLEKLAEKTYFLEQTSTRLLHIEQENNRYYLYDENNTLIDQPTSYVGSLLNNKTSVIIKYNGYMHYLGQEFSGEDYVLDFYSTNYQITMLGNLVNVYNRNYPQGPTGPTGPQGPTGATGPTGAVPTALIINFIADSSNNYVQDNTSYTYQDMEDALAANRTVWFSLVKDNITCTFMVTYKTEDNNGNVTYAADRIHDILQSDYRCTINRDYFNLTIEIADHAR